MAREYSDILAYSRARWEAFTDADTPWIRVGTALCGLAAGAGEVVEAIRAKLAREGVDALVPCRAVDGCDGTGHDAAGVWACDPGAG